jgi:hypothetical protein
MGTRVLRYAKRSPPKAVIQIKELLLVGYILDEGTVKPRGAVYVFIRKVNL